MRSLISFLLYEINRNSRKCVVSPYASFIESPTIHNSTAITGKTHLNPFALSFRLEIWSELNVQFSIHS